MNAKLRRRWFRYSLRTLLIVMTVVCCWLAWESSVVRYRNATRKDLQSSGFSMTTAAEWSRWTHYTIPGGNAPKGAQVSIVRRWLGDEAIQQITYPPHLGTNKEQLARAAKAFPEAELIEQQILYEPCHPGCFPRGTLVETLIGPRAIEDIAAGDSVVAFRTRGERFEGQVESVFVTDNRLWKVYTDRGLLITTETQPLCRAWNDIAPAGELVPGDNILFLAKGEIGSASVLSVARTDRVEQVVNLVLGDCELFVAGGFLARSKPLPQTAPALTARNGGND
jgi:hypothetical protein